MIGFTPNEWIILLLVFALGLVIGMAIMAGGKWKRRYKEEARLRTEEVRRREALEVENRRLAGSARTDTVHHGDTRTERHDGDLRTHHADQRDHGIHRDRGIVHDRDRDRDRGPL